MEISGEQDQLVGTPELAPIGKRIEMLRIEQGLSKQQLAKAAGISRQQLWRVLAGKSELTSSLRDRLAFVLKTDSAVLQQAALEGGSTGGTLTAWFGRATASLTGASLQAETGITGTAPVSFAEFVATPARVRAVLAGLPSCDAGLALKRAFLDAIEDVAMTRDVALHAEFFEIRRAVISRML